LEGAKLIFIVVIAVLILIQVLLKLGSGSCQTVNNLYGVGIDVFELTPEQIQSLNNLKGE
jgi:hypothetical protein